MVLRRTSSDCPQPSCTLRLGRVRSFAASKTGAASNSVCAKMSETNISASMLRFPVSGDESLMGDAVIVSIGTNPAVAQRFLQVRVYGNCRLPDLLRRALKFLLARAAGVTPGDDGFALLVRAVDSSNGRAGILICSRCYRARIQYHYVCRRLSQGRVAVLDPGIGVPRRRRRLV
mgnify:CR=1 FL=1